MTQPDPEVLRNFQRQLAHVDALAQVTLKCHLLIEEAVWAVLSAYVNHPKHLDAGQLRFAQKIALARAVSLDESSNAVWGLIEAFNALRNDLAHSLDWPSRPAKLARLKALYFEICRDVPDIDADRSASDEEITALAGAVCVGFLTSFLREVERYREWLATLDRAVNPHRHVE